LKKDADRRILSVLERKALERPPIWLMRQAGRYLPEYRALRAKAGSFWTLCMTPKMAAEVTVQPIDRFGFDAAILFSDILVVPFALGVQVGFVEGEGPVLDPVTKIAELNADPADWAARLQPVYEALEIVRGSLPPETALLGFAGAPWTLATYMAQGRGSPDQRSAKLWGYRDPEDFAALLDLLADCVAAHLIAQISAGADAVQLFDSWAHGVADNVFDAWVVKPAKKIVHKVREAHPNAKIIGFPRASTLAGYERYVHETGIDAISVDTAVPMTWAAKNLAKSAVVQGNLDPIVLIAGGRALDEAVDTILEAMQGQPHIFNLGHGILPETPIAHVQQLVARVRGAA
jgi:uroporphyrinogen decarboxylase